MPSSEEKKIEELIKTEEKRRERFSRGAPKGTAPAPKPNPEADAGAPKSGWRRLLENVTKDITGR